MARKKTGKRREAMLTAAADVMRRKGVLEARLQDVADVLETTYPAIYHYFSSRDELAGEVLSRSLDRRLEMLAAASGDSALDRLLDFFEQLLLGRKLVQVRPPMIYSLAQPHRRRVAAVRNRLRDEIQVVVEEGVAEGSIEDLDPQTIANVILSLQERFTPFQRSGFPGAAQQLSPDDIKAQVFNTLRRGIIPQDSRLPSEWMRVSDGSHLLNFESELVPEMARLDEILAVATRHFNRDGINASILKMARELGASKTVIYQYVLDKQDLLFQCYLRGIGIVEISHRIADHFGRDPLDAMLVHRHNLYLFHASPHGPFTFLNAVPSLKPQHQRIIEVRNKVNRTTSVERMKRAQLEGLVRNDVNPAIAHPLIGQVLYGLPNWFDEQYHLPIDDVCRQTGTMLLSGLQKAA